MKRDLFTCDVCGKPKQDSNHWFLFQVNVNAAIEFELWGDGILVDNWGHLCGLECAGKKLNEVLSPKAVEK